MAGAESVDVQFLHQEDILLHLLTSHGASAHHTVVMAIYTMYDDWFAVDENLALAAHLDVAESPLASSDVNVL